MFKVGDRVQCKDAKDSYIMDNPQLNILVKDAIYTVTEILCGGKMVRLEHVCGGWKADRFVLVDCDNAKRVEDMLKIFNDCAAGLVSKDFAEGYREACRHFLADLRK